MYLKLMSHENLPDGDPSKTYRLLDHVTSASFFREETGVTVTVWFNDDTPTETFLLQGNTYILNDQGKTIDSFALAS